MPFSEGSEYLLRANGAKFNTLLSHGLETEIELGSEVGERWRRAKRPRCPWERMTVFWVVGFNGFCQIHITGNVRACIPVFYKT